MCKALRAALSKRWLRRRELELSDALHALPKHGVLELEGRASVSEVLTGFAPLRLGAMSYVRSGCELLNVGSVGRCCSIGNRVFALLDTACCELPVGILRGLPLSDPERFMTGISELGSPMPTSCRRVAVSWAGCRELPVKQVF